MSHFFDKKQGFPATTNSLILFSVRVFGEHICHLMLSQAIADGNACKRKSHFHSCFLYVLKGLVP